jgi:hypothetical protein
VIRAQWPVPTRPNLKGWVIQCPSPRDSVSTVNDGPDRSRSRAATAFLLPDRPSQAVPTGRYRRPPDQAYPQCQPAKGRPGGPRNTATRKPSRRSTGCLARGEAGLPVGRVPCYWLTRRGEAASTWIFGEDRRSMGWWTAVQRRKVRA